MVYRRRVVEDRNPMGPILAVIAIIVLLFVGWMLLRDSFGAGDDGNAVVEETPTEEPQEEPADAPDININVPGGEDTGGDQSGAGDQPAGQDEGTEGTGGT